MIKKVRLTESQLRRVVKESVRKILNEDYLYNGQGGWYDEDCSGLDDEPDWDTMSDEELAAYDKEQQMRNDWEDFKWENDGNMRRYNYRNDGSPVKTCVYPKMSDSL